MLEKCKSHGGPVNSIQDLKALVKKHSKEGSYLQKQLRYEVIFRRQIHPNDFRQRPHLYKANKMTVDCLIENLTVLLSESYQQQSGSTVEFPTADEMLAACQPLLGGDEQQATTESIFYFQQPLAVVWDESDDSSKWYVGFYMSGTEDGEVMVDFLEGSMTTWRRPSRDEILTVCLDQILPIQIDGDWEIVPGSSERSTSMIYNVHNASEINLKKMELEKNFNKTL